jgi:hypothetical protein
VGHRSVKEPRVQGEDPKERVKRMVKKKAEVEKLRR